MIEDQMDLTVIYGDYSILINKALLDKMNAWDNLHKIKALHEERLDLEFEMDKTRDVHLLKLYDSLYTLIEFELQYVWGFERDARFHKWWNRPRCICPKIDNEDMYPSGRIILNSRCPLHGD